MAGSSEVSWSDAISWGGSQTAVNPASRMSRLVGDDVVPLDAAVARLPVEPRSMIWPLAHGGGGRGLHDGPRRNVGTSCPPRPCWETPRTTRAGRGLSTAGCAWAGPRTASGSGLVGLGMGARTGGSYAAAGGASGSGGRCPSRARVASAREHRLHRTHRSLQSGLGVEARALEPVNLGRVGGARALALELDKLGGGGGHLRGGDAHLRGEHRGRILRHRQRRVGSAVGFGVRVPILPGLVVVPVAAPAEVVLRRGGGLPGRRVPPRPPAIARTRTRSAPQPRTLRRGAA